MGYRAWLPAIWWTRHFGTLFAMAVSHERAPINSRAEA
jgi:hypothetical protein